MNPGDLAQRQSLPLEAKIILSQQRIRRWYEYWEGNAYISFSGGKDSTVLLYLVRELYPEVPAVFINTGLEYPEIVQFAKSVDNVIEIRPEMSFKQVIEKYGYPVISKEQASYIEEYRNTKSEKLRDKRLNGNKSGRGKISKKWLYLIDAPFKISAKCCDILKKKPATKFEKEMGLHPIIGNLASESAKRVQDYLKFGCNAFEAKRPISRPLGFWTDEDIWNYIRQYKIPYSKIYDMGYDRTGCMFCMFGCHLEKEPNRFQRMKVSHPQLYEYCITKLGLGNVLDYINVKYK